MPLYFKNLLKSDWKILFTLTLTALIVYINIFNNQFVSDDIATFLEDPQIKSFSYVTSRPMAFVRPILYFFTYNIFGPTPFFYHLINFLFHLGCICLVYIILLKLANKKIAIFSSFLFAVHPLLTEAVTWISGGAYSGSAFFLLLSLFFYIKSTKRKFYIFSILAYFFALESQTVVLVIPIILILYEISFGKISKNWPKIIPYIGLTSLWAVPSLLAIPERSETLRTVHYQQGGFDNPFIVIPISLFSYLALIFFPKDLTLYHSELAFTTLSFITMSTTTILFFALIIITFIKNKFLFFWLSFFFVCLLPTLFSGTIRETWIVAERYVYLASSGILISISWIFSKLINIRKIKIAVIILFITILITLSIRTILRNNDWQSEDTLWIATGKTSPSSPNNHNNLGDVYGRHGDNERSIKEFQTAITLKPNYADAYHNLGNAYKAVSRIDDALKSYQKAAELNPHLWQSYQNIAAIYFEQNKMDLCLESIQKAININPKNANLLSNLGIVYLKIGDKEKAKQAFLQALNLDPANRVASFGLQEASK